MEVTVIPAAQRAVDNDGSVPKPRTMTMMLDSVGQAIANARGQLTAAETRRAAADADAREAEQLVRRLERFRADLAGEPQA
jgi:hypothetical protein